MIARTLARRLLSLRSLTPSTIAIVSKPSYSFSKKIQKAPASFSSIVQTQIKAEESNLTDVSGLEEGFKKNGWSIAREHTLVQLTRTSGKYTVRLLSNIKSPSNFDQNEEGNQQNPEQQEEDPYNGDMNEVTICVTKSGSEKTMVVNTIVTESFEITNITFSQNYQSAKQHRLDIYSNNAYTGPEMETISDQLFDSIYGFLEQQCKVDNQTLTSFADYCVDCEQGFYINWLKDLKSIL